MQKQTKKQPASIILTKQTLYLIKVRIGHYQEYCYLRHIKIQCLCKLSVVQSFPLQFFSKVFQSNKTGFSTLDVLPLVSEASSRSWSLGHSSHICISLTIVSLMNETGLPYGYGSPVQIPLLLPNQVRWARSWPWEERANTSSAQPNLVDNFETL